MKQKISQWTVRHREQTVAGPWTTRAMATAHIAKAVRDNQAASVDQYQIVEVVYQLEGFNYYQPKLD
jgi:hypothetical protein